MIPPLIVQEALERGINLIAITDHNSSANVAAVQKAASGTELTVLPGMELQTREEVHVLCLFDTLEQMESWQAEVDASLPDIQNNIDYFGEQFVVDETGEFIRREARLLITSANLTLKESVEGVNRLGGLAIPAHVNRRAFSLIANLGFVPPDLPLEALEISRHISPQAACDTFPQLKNYALIQSGDVHRLEEFMGVNVFRLVGPTIAEIRKALLNQAGRSITIRSFAN
jgi:PHP family Zn ribbon phosphoesterase